MGSTVAVVTDSSAYLPSGLVERHGLTVVPLRSMTNYVHFCQEYFEDVRVPRKNLVGEENQGWYIGAALLDFERSGIGGASGMRRTLHELIDFIRENRGLRQPDISRRPELRQKIADRWIEVEVSRNLSYRIASLQVWKRRATSM